MNGACVVETRSIANLHLLIIDDHLKHLPKDWGLTIYCSKRNHHLVKDVDFGRETNIIVLENDNLTVHGYNELLKSVKFWDSLPYDKVLIFQTDSKLLRSGIEEFLEYDYVGAAWIFQQHGGNGGLSLRNASVMKSICKLNTFTHRNEDVLFCNYMKENNFGKLAPRDVCKKFSIETIYGLGSLGVHAINKYLSERQCEIILNQYK